MKTLFHNGHRIDAPCSSWSGIENVRYDGELVSSKYSMLGADHTFSVQEDGQDAEYQVSIGTKWKTLRATCTIYRNGEMLFTDR